MGRKKDLNTELNTEVEVLQTLGQEDEKKAIKAIKEVMKAEEKKEKDKEDRLLNVLSSRKKSIRSYQVLLRDLLDGLIGTTQLPMGYDYRVTEDLKGIALIIKTPVGYFTRGFKPCHLEKYDLNAVNTIVRDFEDTFDRVKGRTNSKDS